VVLNSISVNINKTAAYTVTMTDHVNCTRK